MVANFDRTINIFNLSLIIYYPFCLALNWYPERAVLKNLFIATKVNKVDNYANLKKFQKSLGTGTYSNKVHV